VRRAVYLDYAAGAPLRPEAREAALRAMDLGGNPSSIHGAGRRARRLIEDARAEVAAFIGAPAEAVVFTSGAVEANNWVLARAGEIGAARLFLSALEHPSVEAAARASGLRVERLPVRSDGRVDLDWLERRLKAKTPAEGPALLALTAACHETGVLQPVERAGALMRAEGGWLHVDAVAAAGKTSLAGAFAAASSLVVSSHKIGGLAGCGALVLAPGTALSPLLHGGGQERGLRAGTENLSGVAAFGAAARAAGADLLTGAPLFAAAAAAGAIADLVQEGAVLIGADAPRLPAFACLAAPGASAQTQVMALDLEGVMVSAGAACSSGKVRRSAVLEAMGLGALAESAVRMSGGWASTAEDYALFAAAWRGALARVAARHERHREVA
jgi:cysteine desulfurase